MISSSLSLISVAATAEPVKLVTPAAGARAQAGRLEPSDHTFALRGGAASAGPGSGTHGSRLGGDASTTYWAKARHHGINRDQGNSILAEYDGDFTRATAHIEAEYEERGE